MKSFLLGLGLGVGIGLLVAPAEGIEPRRRISQKAEELKQYPRRKLQEEIAYARQQAGEIGRKMAQDAFDETTRRVVGQKWP